MPSIKGRITAARSNPSSAMFTNGIVWGLVGFIRPQVTYDGGRD